MTLLVRSRVWDMVERILPAVNSEGWVCLNNFALIPREYPAKLGPKA